MATSIVKKPHNNSSSSFGSNAFASSPAFAVTSIVDSLITLAEHVKGLSRTRDPEESIFDSIAEAAVPGIRPAPRMQN